MKYLLSTRQIKAIERGDSLSVALPHPERAPADYLRWACETLDLAASHVARRVTVHSAERAIITVNPLIVSDGGLAKVLGIIATDSDTSEFLLRVEVVLVELSRGERRGVRGGRPWHQWPGSAVLADGRRIPAVESDLRK